MPLYQHHSLSETQKKLRIHGQRALSVASQRLGAQKQEKPKLRFPDCGAHFELLGSEEEPAVVLVEERSEAVVAEYAVPLFPIAVLQFLHQRLTQRQLRKDLPRNIYLIQ